MRDERRRVSLSDYTPQPVWNYALPDGWSYNGNPVFYNGTVIISAVNNATTTGGLWAIDAQTQDTRWSHSQADVLFGTPVVADGIVYVSDNGGNIWAFAADSTGQMQWQTSYQAATAPSVLGGQLIVTTQDGRIVALELDDGSANWTYATGVSAVAAATSPILSGSVVIASVANTVYALDVATGELLWDYNVDGSLVSMPSVNSSSVYFACDDGFLYALDVSSGDLNWQWPSTPLANVASAAVYYNGAVYLADPEGNFYAINADTGMQLWQTGLTGKIGMLGLAIEDGIAYVMAGVDSTVVLYAVDLQSEGQEVVSYTPAGAAYLIGVETGVCYLASGVGAATNTLGVVNVAGLFHQFFCESELMVEDYVRNSGTGQAQGNSTSFRTHVALFDPNRNPRGGKSVKVWASGPVTITSGGQTYDVDAASTGKTAWLLTDGAGELSIVATASGITTPAIYLWANFMDLEEAIVIYPDHDTLNRLSTVQGSDLSQGTAYDGSSLLPSSYTQADDLASTIRNTIGNTASATQQMRSQNGQSTNRAASMRSNMRAGVARSYIAYPESTPNMVYQATMGPSDRTYVPGAIQSWQANFDSSGGVTFSTGGTLAAQLPPGNIFDDIGDFIDNVVNGVANVVQVAWTDVSQMIVDDAKNVYNIVIKTVEEAAAVVAGVLKTVVGDIMKAIQWLSYLFDWNEYLITKDNIKATAQQGFSNVKTWIDNQLTSGASAVHTFFQNAENSVAADLSWVNSLIGGNSLQSQQQSQNNPQSVYGAGGGKSYTKSRWLTEKFKTNAAQGSLGDTSSPLNDIVSGVQTFYNNVATVLEGPQFTAIPGDINKVLNDFSLLVTDPSDFVTKSFSDIISLVSDLAVTLLQFADAILEGFLQVVQAIVDALFDLLNTPLDIPVLSDLYSMITNGAQLTILDLCCLIVSIPATIITRALSGGGATQRFGSTQGTQDGLLAGALAIYTIIDAAMNLDPETPPPMKLGYAALCLMIEGLSFPSDLASNTGASYVYWVLSICPVAFASFDFASAVGVPLAFFKEWQNVAPVVNTGYGIVILIASILCARMSTQFVGQSNEVLVQNIFNAIGYLSKPCSYFGEDGREVLTVIDGCCDLTVTGLEIALASQAS